MTSTIIADESLALASELQQRSERIWLQQGVVSLRAEIDDGTNSKLKELPTVGSKTSGRLDRSRAIINCLHSAIDLADNPRLLGA
ncbi:MAG: hypothetical protein DMF88_10245, partial [Acidobacteria bacterium]